MRERPGKIAVGSPHAFSGLNFPFCSFDQVVMIGCEVRDALQAIYEPYNTALYEMMKEDHEKQLVPPEEPAFPRFKLCSCNRVGELTLNG